MSNYPRFKGAPFNLYTIRWHKSKRGFEWQYWNCKVNKFCKYTNQNISKSEAIVLIAKYCYGCDPTSIKVEE